MQFYKISGYLIDDKWFADNTDRREAKKNAKKILHLSYQFNAKQRNGNYFFLSNVNEDGEVIIGAITNENENVESLAKAYLKAIWLEINDISIEEVLLSTMKSMLSTSCVENYIEDDDDVLENFGLDRFTGRWGRNLDNGENLIEDIGRNNVYDICEKYIAKESMVSEIERIYRSKCNPKIIGHPCHYILSVDDREIRKELYRGLLSALHEVGRLRNKRYCFVDFEPGTDFSRAAFDALYNSCCGGAVIVRFVPTENGEEGQFASTDRRTISSIAEMLRKYRNRVLTVLCLPRECTKIKEIFYENLGNLCIIELKEDLATDENAKSYLKMMAKENHIRADKNLYMNIVQGEGYLSSELRVMFDIWYDEKLRRTIYPEYKDASPVKKELQKITPKGNAYDELQSMIGLSSAKEVIGSALNYYKAQKLFKEKGMLEDHPTMSMIFTGNPGSAKTTVARLFAEIMKDNGILSNGQLIECGRADLVGQYVGWTAVQVKRKFKQAVGGVLFIDEAYALADRSGSFGDEAINTIVQEMENHRDDTVVIFAGYPDKMEDFLDRNPGLRSRIAFHVQFDDYSASELVDISKHIAEGKGLKLTPEAICKLSEYFEAARLEPDFGNGRAARNIIEKSRMAQSSRLIKEDFDEVTKDDIVTIKGEDIVLPECKTDKTRRIGFCA